MNRNINNTIATHQPPTQPNTLLLTQRTTPPIPSIANHHDMTQQTPSPGTQVPTNSTNTTVPTVHKISYQNQFCHSYKTDERTIKNIIANNVQCSNKSDTLKFIPYYRSNTITKLITRNNQGLPHHL